VKAVEMVKDESHLGQSITGMCCSGVEFSHLLTNHILFTKHPTSTFFFSALSYYPGRKIDVPLARLSDVISDINQFSDTHGGETEIKSEDDWRHELQPLGPGCRLLSALALEVRF
jgi:hypothetical protein